MISETSNNNNNVTNVELNYLEDEAADDGCDKVAIDGFNGDVFKEANEGEAPTSRPERMSPHHDPGAMRC